MPFRANTLWAIAAVAPDRTASADPGIVADVAGDDADARSSADVDGDAGRAGDLDIRDRQLRIDVSTPVPSGVAASPTMRKPSSAASVTPRATIAAARSDAVPGRRTMAPRGNAADQPDVTLERQRLAILAGFDHDGRARLRALQRLRDRLRRAHHDPCRYRRRPAGRREARSAARSDRNRRTSSTISDRDEHDVAEPDEPRRVVAALRPSVPSRRVISVSAAPVPAHARGGNCSPST